VADKRITTVNEMGNPNENADFILVVRGTQQDLRRMRMNRLPGGFDLHDDVNTELTTLAGHDRLLMSDEGTPGFPNRWVRLSTLQAFLTNAFDLHDDVTTELSEAAAADRLLISDEDQSGDPQKWISAKNLLKSLNSVAYEKLSNAIPMNNGNVVINHSLGRVPVGCIGRLICQTAEAGYSVGDEILLAQLGHSTSSSSQFSIVLSEASSTQVRVRTQGTNTMWVPNKTTTGSTSIAPHLSSVKWRVGVTIFG